VRPRQGDAQPLGVAQIRLWDEVSNRSDHLSVTERQRRRDPVVRDLLNARNSIGQVLDEDVATHGQRS